MGHLHCLRVVYLFEMIMIPNKDIMSAFFFFMNAERVHTTSSIKGKLK